jgi:hypothetical protein
MKKEKLTLKVVKNVLSRTELRQIMAGSLPCVGLNMTCGGESGQVCCSPNHCSLNDPSKTGFCIM